MPQSILFSLFLSEQLVAKDLDILTLARELGYRTLVSVDAWVDGRALPLPSELPAIAKVLDADPVEVSVIWLISQCPDLKAILEGEVLIPRGTQLPEMV
jgi:hypothetical protein